MLYQWRAVGLRSQAVGALSSLFFLILLPFFLPRLLSCPLCQHLGNFISFEFVSYGSSSKLPQTWWRITQHKLTAL